MKQTLLPHEIHELFADGIVRHGPFRGLQYPELSSIGSALYPKLLGSYESELHPWMREICEAGYSEIIDVGCAEGYYAVGLARNLPRARVYAYDIQPSAQQRCAHFAAANQVAHRLSVRACFTANELLGIVVRQRGLIICDCEGAEARIFTEQSIHQFAAWDLLIETHDFLDINISTRLIALFQNTHNIRTLASIDDIQKAKTYNYPELSSFDLDTRRAILAECRPAIMEWLFLKPRAHCATEFTTGATAVASSHDQSRLKRDGLLRSQAQLCEEDGMTLIEAIENAGSDHLPTFGGSFEGGYCIQQNPAEFADLVGALMGRGIHSYLQIGSAAGGAERLLCEYVGVRDLTIIDDGRHPKFHVWKDVNRPALEAHGVAVSQYIGDSHSLGAREFLAQHKTPFDLIGIDGDHTSAGVRMDWELIVPFVKSGTLVWFHDLSDFSLPPGQRGGKEVWDIVSTRHKVVLETYSRCGIGMLEIV